MLAFAATAIVVLACSEEGLQSPVGLSTTTSPSAATTPSTMPASPRGTVVSIRTTTTTRLQVVSTTTSTTHLTHVIAVPARVVIPILDVDAKIVPVGIAKNGGMEVPDVRFAGWYKLGPAPGAPGPSVVISHVSYKGTHGPFYDLKRLEPGDEILVYDALGDCAVFQVDYQETVLKTELPTERIWDDTKESVIRLITCGGKFNRQTRHYESNVIVYGHLVR
jgi:sortase (surface protein transpeptidase)